MFRFRNGGYIIRLLILVVVTVISVSVCKKSETGKKMSWSKKDIREYDDTDLERLYSQWEEDEEPLPPDELSEFSPPKHENFPFDKIGSMPTDEIMKIAKKGQAVIMFVNLDGHPSQNDCDKLTGLWQFSLSNNHIQVDRYIIGSNQAIFLFENGSQAWDAKEYLLDQEGLSSITLEGQYHTGKRRRSEG